MKRFLLTLLLAIMAFTAIRAREYQVWGPQGGLSFKITLPEGFNPDTDSCTMVILMHGIFSSKDYNPMPALAKGLACAGIASIRFDFDGHGKSEGRLQDMTIEKEISDAMAIWEYVQGLPYVSDTGFLGHSQGGVIASMTAGRLAQQGRDIPKGLVLIAPGSVMRKIIPLGFKYGSGKGWKYVWHPEDPKDYYHFETLECLYKHVFSKYGILDRFGPMFCRSDIINYGNLHNIDFIRTQTLCQGGDCCDFRFVRHRKGEVWERTKSI